MPDLNLSLADEDVSSPGGKRGGRRTDVSLLPGDGRLTKWQLCQATSSSLTSLAGPPCCSSAGICLPMSLSWLPGTCRTATSGKGSCGTSREACSRR
jgi:hypothetical protein